MKSREEKILERTKNPKQNLTKLQNYELNSLSSLISLCSQVQGGVFIDQGEGSRSKSVGAKSGSQQNPNCRQLARDPRSGGQIWAVEPRFSGEIFLLVG